MKITKITIDNYKSVKHLEFEPSSGLNAFIGANSTGKSNVFDAINWLLGPAYPSFNSTKKEDRFLGDENNKIAIHLDFDDKNYLELTEEWTDSYGRTKSGLNYNGSYCTSENRERYCCAYLGVEREILDYLPSNKWSLVGRILQEINKRFLGESMQYNNQTKAKKEWLKEWLTFIRDKLLFSVKDESGQEVMKKFMTILQEESARQLNRPQSDFIVDLSLYDPWNFYRTLQLIVKEQDMGLEFQASNLGMGVQASISIAILKAYSELNLANKSPIFIDEPELYLHPQSQRNFYKILRDLSEDKHDVNRNLVREGTQVFYTTHSPNFLSAGYFNEIFLVRKTREQGSSLRYAKVSDFIQDLKIRRSIESSTEDLLLHYKNAYENTGDTQKANEGFFAKKIILVEGQSETLLLPYFFDLVGFDFVKECISIVRCGSKSEIDRFYRLYSEFGIPCYVVFDGDKQLESTSKKQDNIEKNRAILELFGETGMNYPDSTPKDRCLGFEYEFEKTLGFDTAKKGLDLFIEAKKKISENSLGVPSWVEVLKDKIGTLPESEIESVLKKR